MFCRKVLVHFFVIIFTFVGCIGDIYGQGKIQNKTVINFGANGDGLTNDTKAIQKAINSGIKQVIFPPGRYRLTNSIKINLDKVGPVSLIGRGTATILMEGEGPAFKIIGSHLNGSAAPKTIRNNVWQNQRMPLIDGLEIVGKNPKAEGIEAVGTMQLTITRLLVRRAFHGIHLVKQNRNVIISNVHIYDNKGIGIFLDKVNLHQINITGSHISYNRGGGIVVLGGTVRNLQIGSCDIEANMGEKSSPTANVFIDVSKGGSVREGAITGCTIQHTHKAPKSANIWFKGRGPNERQKVGKFTIADNIMSDIQYNIHIQGGQGFIITGNTIYKGVTDNIFIQNSNDILVGPNMMERNMDYWWPSFNAQNTITIQNSNNITINGLHLHHAFGRAGIILYQCKNYNITSSTFLNCEGGGILLKNTENGKVSGNFILDNLSNVKKPIAIQVEGGKNNFITNNYVNGVIKGKPETGKIINNYNCK